MYEAALAVSFFFLKIALMYKLIDKNQIMYYDDIKEKPFWQKGAGSIGHRYATENTKTKNEKSDIWRCRFAANR